ncbi:MAG: MFS transporter [Christensenellaceae bacterium]
MINKKIDQKKLMYVMALLLWFSQYIYMPYQTPYLVAIGVASPVIGVVVGAYGFPQMLLRFPFGIMADRRPRHKFFITLGVALAGLASVSRIFIQGEWGFLIGSVLSGIASSTWVSVMIVHTGLFGKKEQAMATGQMFSASNLGILLAFVFASAAYEGMGMFFLCWVGITSSAVAIALSLFVREPEGVAEPRPVKELVSVIKNKELVLFAVFNLVQQGIVASTALSFTTQIAKTLSTSDLQVGLCSVIYILTAVLSAAFTGRKPFDRLGAKVMIPVILLGLFAYCLIVPNVQSIYVLYAVQVLAGFSQGMFLSYCTTEGVKNVPPEKKSTAMGFYQSVYAVGLTVFPVIAGTVVQAVGMSSAYYVLSVIVAVAFVAAAMYYKKKRQTSI